MKQVKCDSGITGWQDKLQNNYSSFEEFKSYCRVYGIHKRLGFSSMKNTWESNPIVRGSIIPSDLKRVYFHVVKTNNGFRIKETTEELYKNVKNSLISFTSIEAAKFYLSAISL